MDTRTAASLAQFQLFVLLIVLRHERWLNLSCALFVLIGLRHEGELHHRFYLVSNQRLDMH
jgi:hypothetical protein